MLHILLIDTNSLEFWNVIATLIFTFIGVLIFRKMWDYIQAEMKTASKYTIWDKIRNFLASFTFSTIVAVAIVFVLALITTAIAVNILYTLDTTNIDITPVMIQAWQFPTFLPITLLIITGFAFIYPLYEYIALASPAKEAPMEIQQWLENNVIKRADPPWSYLVSILLFLAIFVVVPIIISIIFIQTLNITGSTGGAIPEGWVVGLVFITWLLSVGPIFYLTYYSKIGTAHLLFRGLKVNLKKDKVTAIWFGIAVLSTLSSIYAFVNIIAGNFPEAASNPAEAQGGFLEYIVELVMAQNPKTTPDDIANWELFKAIIPLDFLTFFITTAGFGLLGFYVKFLSKEPLNRPNMVLFGAYIITGIAFSIFTNAVIQWPYIFPDDNLAAVGLNIDLTNPVHQQAIVNLLIPAFTIEKIFNIIFLVKFLFYTKEIPANADEWVLNRAIIENDFETITKYVKSNRLEIRKMALESIISYIRLSEKLSKETSQYISQVLGDLILDDEKEIQDIINNNLLELISKLWLDVISDTLVKLLQTEEKENLNQSTLILKNIAKQDISRLERALKKILYSNISNSGRIEFFNTLRYFSRSNSNIVPSLILPKLASENNPDFLIQALSLIKETINDFKPFSEKLYPYLKHYIHHENSAIISHTIDLYATIIAESDWEKDTGFLIFRPFMEELSKLETINLSIIRAKISAFTKLIIANPENFKELFPYFEGLLNPENANMIVKRDSLILKQSGDKITSNEVEINRNEIIADIAITLGTIAISVSIDQFRSSIFPLLTQLIQNEDLGIKKATMSSMMLISQTQSEIYADPQFQLLLGKLLNSSKAEIRHQIYDLITIEDLVRYIAGYIETELDYVVRIDFLNILYEKAEIISKIVEKTDLIAVLQKQDFIHSRLTNSKEIQELFGIYSNLFGHFHLPDVISILDCTVAVFYRFAYYNPSLLSQFQEFLDNHLQQANQIGISEMLHYYSHNHLLQTDESISFNTLLTKFAEFINEEHLINSAMIDFFEAKFQQDPMQHKLIFGWIFAINKLIKKDDLELRNRILVLLATMVGKFPETYYIQQEFLIPPKNQKHEFHPFIDYLQKMFMELMEIDDKKTQNSIEIAINSLLLAETLEKEAAKELAQQKSNSRNNQVEENFLSILEILTPSQIIKNFLVEVLEEAETDIARISALKAILALPIQIINKKYTNILLKSLSTKNLLLRIQLIKAIGKQMQNFPTLPGKVFSSRSKKLKKLVYKSLFSQYSPESPLEVRKVILNEIEQVFLKQPEISIIITTAKKIAMDPDPDIATQIINLFFEFLDQNPSKKELILPYIRHFANSNLPEVSSLLVQKLIRLYSEKVAFSKLLPTLMRLCTSENLEIRHQSLKVLEQIYQENPEEFIFFLDIILKLTNHRSVDIRQDATNTLFTFLFERPELVQNNTTLFKNLRVLSRDSDHQVRLSIAGLLDSMVKVFPNRMNDILQIAYNFLKNIENDIMEKTSIAMKVIWRMHPELTKEIMQNLKRYYKKSQDGMLLTLIKELED